MTKTDREEIIALSMMKDECHNMRINKDFDYASHIQGYLDGYPYYGYGKLKRIWICVKMVLLPWRLMQNLDAYHNVVRENWWHMKMIYFLSNGHFTPLHIILLMRGFRRDSETWPDIVAFASRMDDWINSDSDGDFLSMVGKNEFSMFENLQNVSILGNQLAAKYLEGCESGFSGKEYSSMRQACLSLACVCMRIESIAKRK